MKKILSAVMILTLVCVMLLAGCGDAAKNIQVGTGGNTGTYYAFTNAVGTILQEKTGLKFSVVSTGGSVANINGIEAGRAAGMRVVAFVGTNPREVLAKAKPDRIVSVFAPSY